MFFRRLTTSLAVVVVPMWLSGAAVAQTVEEFYSGHTVTFTVSAPAGTLTDVVARQFAPYFTRYMEGNPRVVVQNVAGAGGMLAAAQLQQGSATDGTVIGFLQRNNLYVPLVEDNFSSFDPREVTWLGSLEKVDYSIVVAGSSSPQSTEDLFNQEVFLGATGYSNENRTIPALLNDRIGTQFNIIHGYSGRGEVYLAMERGEVDGWASTVAGLAVGDTRRQVEEGELRVLLHLGWTSHPAFPDVPNLTSYVAEEDRALLDFFILPLAVGRPIAVPAGVPQDRVDALEAAIAAAASDPDFIAEMEAQGYLIEPVSGDAVTEIIQTLFATPSEALEEVRALMTAREPGN